jgi:hypothetical protein
MARISFSGRRFKQELILQSVRWYLADVLSYRDIEEMIQERCINVDHRTIHRWMIHYAPQLEKNSERRNANLLGVGGLRKPRRRLKTNGNTTIEQWTNRAKQLTSYSQQSVMSELHCGI